MTDEHKCPRCRRYTSPAQRLSLGRHEDTRDTPGAWICSECAARSYRNEVIATPVRDGLDMPVSELVRRLAENGAHLRAELRLEVVLGTGVGFHFVGYPVPGGFRLESQRSPHTPPEYFLAIVRAAGFEAHPDNADRWVRVIPLPAI